MANFTIGVINRKESKQNGYVQLRFTSDAPQRLIIKDICFWPKPTKIDNTIIIPVYLVDGVITQTINFPDKYATYDKLEFMLKQEGEKGWKVSVDLNSDTIPMIEESIFRVL